MEGVYWGDGRNVLGVGVIIIKDREIILVIRNIVLWIERPHKEMKMSNMRGWRVHIFEL